MRVTECKCKVTDAFSDSFLAGDYFMFNRELAAQGFNNMIDPHSLRNLYQWEPNINTIQDVFLRHCVLIGHACGIEWMLSLEYRFDLLYAIRVLKTNDLGNRLYKMDMSERILRAFMFRAANKLLDLEFLLLSFCTGYNIEPTRSCIRLLVCAGGIRLPSKRTLRNPGSFNKILVGYAYAYQERVRTWKRTVGVLIGIRRFRRGECVLLPEIMGEIIGRI
jgi:hypothetical protein